MEINPATPLVSQTNTTAAAASTAQGNRLADDFDTFLTLLTTQLENQDPLDPTDTNEFTNQLVAFAGVEQQIRTNDQLETLSGMVAFAQNTAAVNFLGREATVRGSSGENLGNGIAFAYALPTAAEDVELQVLDDRGRIVFREDGATSAGTHDFVWPGTDNQGNAEPTGTYQIRVAAKDASGNQIPVQTFVRGVVSEVETSTSIPVLTVSGNQVPLQDVITVRDPS
ncbi:MAG: flagellar hook assembly protein FlgD [Alphaproteobacteria bacterium]|nr:MAG: flagellar hook assembly protein FlgD [Alphaproteobacteria bacterium]